MIKDTKKLKERIFSHPLFPKLKEKYPYRDYDYNWDLMIDWWLNNKRKLPVYISAFDNWLKRTPIDGDIKMAADREYQLKENNKRNIVINENPNPEGLKKMEELRKKWLIKKV